MQFALTDPDQQCLGPELPMADLVLAKAAAAVMIQPPPANPGHSTRV